MEAVAIITCLLFSAFFSGMEIAYLSSNKVYLEVEKKQATIISGMLSRLTANPSQFITAMILGNSIALVLYAYYAGSAAMRWVSGYGLSSSLLLVIQVAITSFILLLTAEFLPKILSSIYANTLMKVLVVPAYGFYTVFNPLSRGLIMLTDFILVKVLHTKAEKQQGYFSRGELGNYITEQLTNAPAQEEVDSEIQIFQNALQFSDMKARDIMTPRTDISGIEINSTVDGLKQLFIATGYSKIVVYRHSIDTVVGYVHSFELFKKPESIGSAMIPIEVVPETILIKELLDTLTRRRKSMAVVLDEYGGTAGIITVEDIIEELFGEIEDEHDDAEELPESLQDDGSYLFSARFSIESINAKYGLGLPESPSYSTIGGLIVNLANDIPEEGEKISVSGFDIFIMKASGNMIELVKIVPSGLK
ncbi:hemolysin family protein [Flavobacterium sp. J372]|uniref:hemolysin family protein n=1 Tax=Flavobacterium sp. J372 TaxID=2898436 RepID=UPI002151BA73|nr:hemolysin family protein [Flavobacterium sp. J372]MCR5863341.1 hemolysin family protein [Flavobacterium sp. J372]